MKATVRFLITASVLFILQSCKDIIEQDISNAKLNIVSPIDNYRSDSYQVTFWWDEVEGAQKYRIQIAIPSFDSLQVLSIDTAITDVKYVLTLFPGRYQWRIRAENGNSYTSFITRNLTIDSNTTLTGQPFNVDYPVDMYFSNNRVINFGWSAFPGATSYEYVFADTNNIPVKNKTIDQLFVVDTLAEGTYIWKVRAVNIVNGTKTEYSAIRRVSVDQTPPVTSTLSAPANQTLIQNPVQLVWIRNGDVYADSIQVATDSLFTNIQLAQLIAGNVGTISLPPLTIGTTYFWRLKSRDKANNWSPFSSVFSFTVTL